MHGLRCNKKVETFVASFSSAYLRCKTVRLEPSVVRVLEVGSVRRKSEVKARVGCPSAIVDFGACDALVDMRRRWSNNGGFQTLRMLEESSSEVTSSSALGLPAAMVMSPDSLASPEYGGLELWGYDDGLSYNTAQSLLGNTCTMQQQQQTQPLPSMPLPMPPTTPKSENESISSG